MKAYFILLIASCGMASASTKPLIDMKEGIVNGTANLTSGAIGLLGNAGELVTDLLANSTYSLFDANSKGLSMLNQTFANLTSNAQNFTPLAIVFTSLGSGVNTFVQGAQTALSLGKLLSQGVFGMGKQAISATTNATQGAVTTGKSFANSFLESQRSFGKMAESGVSSIAKLFPFFG